MKLKLLFKSGKFWLVIIFLFGALLRFYKLGQVPAGFVNDEASFGYNAYSLIKTGKDEFGQPWPLIFYSFGDGKMPVYFYLTLPAVLIFGLNEFAVRLPSALFGSLNILVTFFWVKEFLSQETNSWRKKFWPLTAAFVLATLPWHIHFSRAAFEANLGLFWVSLATCLLLKFINHPQKIWSLVLSFLSFVLTILSYHAPRLFVPIFLGFVSLWLYKKLTRRNWFKFVFLGLAMVGLPWFLLTVSKQSRLRAGGITIFHEQSGVMIRLNQKFMETRNQPLVLTRALHNKIESYSREFIQRYVAHFDLDFLFIHGDPTRPRYRVPDIGLSLLLGLPFYLIGLYLCLKKKYWLILFLLIIAPIPAAITFETPSSIRALLMILPFSLIISLGTAWFLFRGRVLWLLALIFIYNFAFYLDAYYVHGPMNEPYEWQGGYKELVAKVTRLMPEFDKAVITDARGSPYIYFLFYNQYDPQKWHFQAKDSITIDPKFKYISVGKLDNLYFVDKTCPANPQQWPADAGVPEPGILYVCTEEHHPAFLLEDETLKIIDTVYFENGQPSFFLMARTND